eukprot:TRINITY_DN4671_c0_g1_i1.p1 TRINITY_DN4671_c0_g1~~TRINITY_DN4671_c0_g1_i1.p1  ORF type:complete len:586 (-),score=139.01 TRINITY_DN4671_c0_g1_i1:8-1765(-)
MPSDLLPFPERQMYEKWKGYLLSSKGIFQDSLIMGALSWYDRAYVPSNIQPDPKVREEIVSILKERNKYYPQDPNRTMREMFDICCEKRILPEKAMGNRFWSDLYLYCATSSGVASVMASSSSSPTQPSSSSSYPKLVDDLRMTKEDKMKVMQDVQILRYSNLEKVYPELTAQRVKHQEMLKAGYARHSILVDAKAQDQYVKSLPVSKQYPAVFSTYTRAKRVPLTGTAMLKTTLNASLFTLLLTAGATWIYRLRYNYHLGATDFNSLAEIEVTEREEAVCARREAFAKKQAELMAKMTPEQKQKFERLKQQLHDQRQARLIEMQKKMKNEPESLSDSQKRAIYHARKLQLLKNARGNEVIDQPPVGEEDKPKIEKQEVTEKKRMDETKKNEEEKKKNEEEKMKKENKGENKKNEEETKKDADSSKEVDALQLMHPAESGVFEKGYPHLAKYMQTLPEPVREKIKYFHSMEVSMVAQNRRKAFFQQLDDWHNMFYAGLAVGIARLRYVRGPSMVILPLMIATGFVGVHAAREGVTRLYEKIRYNKPLSRPKIYVAPTTDVAFYSGLLSSVTSRIKSLPCFNQKTS